MSENQRRLQAYSHQLPLYLEEQREALARELQEQENVRTIRLVVCRWIQERVDAALEAQGVVSQDCSVEEPVWTELEFRPTRIRGIPLTAETDREADKIADLAEFILLKWSVSFEEQCSLDEAFLRGFTAGRVFQRGHSEEKRKEHERFLNAVRGGNSADGRRGIRTERKEELLKSFASVAVRRFSISSDDTIPSESELYRFFSRHLEDVSDQSDVLRELRFADDRIYYVFDGREFHLSLPRLWRELRDYIRQQVNR